MSLIQTLPNCPLDIIGDVHGQIEALQNLLHYLGYTPAGKHPQGRKLVLVGDLVDRGPDSPAVLDLFRQIHLAGNAFMVLGNHEINLLMHEPKDGSGWFFDCRVEKDSYHYAPWQRLPEKQRNSLIQFLQQQPLILQRPDLRIVHAAWLPQSIEKIKENQNSNIIQLIQEWDDELHCCIKHAPWFDDYLEEQRQYAHGLENNCVPPPMLHATATHDIYRSSRHPVRALTCGIEKAADAPFFAGGRWRFSVRNPWWEDYTDSADVVIGHYWRTWHNLSQPKHRENIFTMPPHHWHGARKNVFCVDFSVGARWRDRKKGITPAQSDFRLAALRYPEKTLMFDNGDVEQTLF
ncbi:metallophosphoesterase [Wielerella bovis]|uniref:metallophosphoesterase n=1 Tax=Wielerella bovis TaxID=2917790 RepID=UPI002019D9E3|nr:metallophosphoesterase [Wielerella bovis]ULJ60940.1 metallophosphoesterase [Wielerella bovis]